MMVAFFYYVVFLGSCLPFKSQQSVNLGQADLQWLSMAASIEKSITDKENGPSKDEQNVRLIGDVSQKYLIRGLIIESEEDLLTARKYGLQCLQSESGFHSLMQTSGGRISGLTMRSLAKPGGT